LAKWTVTEGRWKGEHIGLTCAACHNGQLNYKGQKIRIDGGIGNTFDFVAYIGELSRSLQATVADAAKFDRLAGASRRFDCGRQGRSAQAPRGRCAARCYYYFRVS
jgi:hypothetical protein